MKNGSVKVFISLVVIAVILLLGSVVFLGQMTGQTKNELANPPANALGKQTMSFTAQSVSQVKKSEATITWSTSTASTGVLYYGKTATDQPESLNEPNQALNHQQTISNLLPNTTYYYRVVAIGQQGSAASPVLSFRTAP